MKKKKKENEREIKTIVGEKKMSLVFILGHAVF